MNLLVTGAAGFIGSHLCERLLYDKHFVIGLDNFDSYYAPLIKEKNVELLLHHKNFVLVRDDIRNKNVMQSLLGRYEIDCVFHLAAKAGVRPSIEDPLIYADTNINGTITVLEAMKETNVKNMIFASSSSVYGNQSKVPFSENDPALEPISPYATTKRAGELLCYTYHHLYNINVTCLRFFTVYGPRQRPEMAIHKFARNIIDNQPISFFGDGSMSRDYTYINDIISGIIASYNNLKGFNIYNLGNSSPTKLSDLISLLEIALSRKAYLEYSHVPPGDVNITFADITKANRNLNYLPIVNIREGIIAFCKWLTENN